MTVLFFVGETSETVPLPLVMAGLDPAIQGGKLSAHGSGLLRSQ